MAKRRSSGAKGANHSNPKGGKVSKGGSFSLPSSKKAENFSPNSPFDFSALAKREVKPVNSGFNKSRYADNKEIRRSYDKKPKILPNDDLYQLLLSAKKKLQTNLAPIPPKDWDFNSNIQFLKIIKAYHPESMERDEIIGGKELRCQAAEIIMEVLLRSPDNQTFSRWLADFKSKALYPATPEDKENYLKYHDKGALVSRPSEFDVLAADLKHAASVCFFSGRIDYQKWYDVTSALDNGQNIPVLFSLSELLATDNFNVQNYIDSGMDYLVYKDWENINSVLSYKDNYESIKKLLAEGEENTSRLLIEYWSANKDKKEIDALSALIPDKFKAAEKIQAVSEPNPAISPKASEFPIPSKSGLSGNGFFFTDFLDTPKDFAELSAFSMKKITALKELVPPLSEIMKNRKPEVLKDFFTQNRPPYQALLAPWIVSSWDKVIAGDMEKALEELICISQASPSFFKSYTKGFSKYLEAKEINIQEMENKLNNYSQEIEDKKVTNILSLLVSSCRSNGSFPISPLEYVNKIGLLDRTATENVYVTGSMSVFMPSILYLYEHRKALQGLFRQNPYIKNSFYEHWNTQAFRRVTSGNPDLIRIGIAETRLLIGMDKFTTREDVAFLFKTAPHLPAESLAALKVYSQEHSQENDILISYINAFSLGAFKKGKDTTAFSYNGKIIRLSEKEIADILQSADKLLPVTERKIPEILTSRTPNILQAKKEEIILPAPLLPKNSKEKAPVSPADKPNIVRQDSGLVAELVQRLYKASLADIERAENNIKFLRDNFPDMLPDTANNPSGENIIPELIEEITAKVEAPALEPMPEEIIPEESPAPAPEPEAVFEPAPEPMPEDVIPEEAPAPAPEPEAVFEPAPEPMPEEVIPEESPAPAPEPEAVSAPAPKTVPKRANTNYANTPPLLQVKPDSWPKQKEEPKTPERKVAQFRAMPCGLPEQALFFTDFLDYPQSFASLPEKRLAKMYQRNELIPDLSNFYDKKEAFIDLFSCLDNDKYDALLLPFLNRTLKKIISGDLREGIKELGMLTEIEHDFSKQYVRWTLRQMPKNEEEKKSLISRLHLGVDSHDFNEREQDAWEMCKLASVVRPSPAQRFLLTDYIDAPLKIKGVVPEEQCQIINRIGLIPSLSDIRADTFDICEFLDDIDENLSYQILNHWLADSVTDILKGDIAIGLRKAREFKNIDSEFYEKNISAFLPVAVAEGEQLQSVVAEYADNNPDSLDILTDYLEAFGKDNNYQAKAKMSGALPQAVKDKLNIGLKPSAELLGVSILEAAKTPAPIMGAEQKIRRRPGRKPKERTL